MLRKSWFSNLTATLGAAALMVPATADEDFKKERVEIRVEKSSTQQDDNEPEVKGRIIIKTPDGVQEFSLDDNLPKNLTIDLPVDVQNLIKQGGPGRIAIAQSADAAPQLMIGLQLDEPSEALRSHLKLDGVALIVTEALADLPAAAAGVQKHDVILTVNGERLKNRGSLTQAVAKSGGEPVRLSGLRGGEEFSVEVTPQKAKHASIRIQPRQLNISSVAGLDGIFDGNLEPRVLKGIRIQAGEKFDPAEIEKIMKEAMNDAVKLHDINIRVDSDIKQLEDGENTLREEVRALQRRLDRLTRSLDRASEGSVEGRDQDDGAEDKAE